jgi:hypothetical protein
MSEYETCVRGDGSRCVSDPDACVEAGVCWPGKREVFHACPPENSGLTPCCGRSPLELPRDDRLTTTPSEVTCRG